MASRVLGAGKMGDDFLSLGLRDAASPQLSDMPQLREGKLDAVSVAAVLSPQECVRIVEALETNAPEFETTQFPGPFKSFFYGRNLNLNEPDLTEYFRAASRFDAALGRLADIAGFDPVARVSDCLSAMDDGRRYRPAPGPHGGAHFQTTFRGHRPGGYIPAHFDNEQNFRPSYRHVAACTQGNIFSVVLTLAAAESGGVLEMYDLLSDDLDRGPSSGLRNDDRHTEKPDLATLRCQPLPVSAGSMLVVRSGARLHRVSPVEGDRNRWTMCSFMASSRHDDSIYCWG